MLVYLLQENNEISKSLCDVKDFWFSKCQEIMIFNRAWTTDLLKTLAQFWIGTAAAPNHDATTYKQLKNCHPYVNACLLPTKFACDGLWA